MNKYFYIPSIQLSINEKTEKQGNIKFNIMPVATIIVIVLLSFLYNKSIKCEYECVELWNCGEEYINDELRPNANQFSLFYLENALFVKLKYKKKTNGNENKQVGDILSSIQKPEMPKQFFQEPILRIYELFLHKLTLYSTKISDCIQNGNVRIYYTYILISFIIMGCLYLIWS